MKHCAKKNYPAAESDPAYPVFFLLSYPVFVLSFSIYPIFSMLLQFSLLQKSTSPLQCPDILVLSGIHRICTHDMK